MKILVTGADGFIGKNLCAHLKTRNDLSVIEYTRKNTQQELFNAVKEASFVFHLAGVNRSTSVNDFQQGNVDLTLALCEALSVSGNKTPLVYTSSTQATLANPYGESKHNAEQVLETFSRKCQFPLYLFRLPNVFGKWTRPHYNSAVATFCYQIARDLPIQVNDPSVSLNLVYIDDVISCFMTVLDKHLVSEKSSSDSCEKNVFCSVEPIYTISVGELASQIRAFRESRTTLMTDAVGTGLIRALYSTYVSYLPQESFSYDVPKYADPRGVFVEMLKTKETGQFSYFTAYPGVTRGGHYHHSKTEKFLVIKGQARFRFRQLITNEYYELVTTGEKPEIVETVPGWTHDITNIGDDELIVMLWANEVFERNRPDTYACEI